MTNMVDLKAYWDAVKGFSAYPDGKRYAGYKMGLRAEAGELAGVMDKWLRGKAGHQTVEQIKPMLLDECGDLLWYTCAWLSLDDVKLVALCESFATGLMGLDSKSLCDMVDTTTFHAFENSLRANPSLHFGINTLEAIGEIAAYFDTSLQAILDANVRKLQVRNPPPESQQQACGVCGKQDTMDSDPDEGY